MGRAFVKNTTFNLQVGQQKKNSQSSLLYLLVWAYIFFQRLWESAKKGRYVSNLRSFWSQMCAPSLAKEKTATLNPKPFQQQDFGYGNAAQDHVSGIVASSKVWMGRAFVKKHNL